MLNVTYSQSFAPDRLLGELFGVLFESHSFLTPMSEVWPEGLCGRGNCKHFLKLPLCCPSVLRNDSYKIGLVPSENGVYLKKRVWMGINLSSRAVHACQGCGGQSEQFQSVPLVFMITGLPLTLV